MQMIHISHMSIESIILPNDEASLENRAYERSTRSNHSPTQRNFCRCYTSWLSIIQDNEEIQCLRNQSIGKQKCFETYPGHNTGKKASQDTKRKLSKALKKYYQTINSIEFPIFINHIS